jgi:uncharacterized repeat protein (TIGR01451 family)
MTFSLKPFKRAGLACVALGAIAVSQQALALGTAANTTIENRATVNYQVGGTAQDPIESSPAGNSNPGLGNGADTEFLVDNKIDLTVTEVGAAPTTVAAGATNVVTTFAVINTGNFTQGYNLSALDVGGSLFTHNDTFDMAPGSLSVRVSVAACAINPATEALTSPTPAYNPATDTAQNIDTLGSDDCTYVFIVANTPAGVANGGAANVQLTALAREANTRAEIFQTAGAESPMVVDMVWADTDRDATEASVDQYYVQTAALSVAKTSVVISDPLNLAVNPKAIPGATMEYGITLTNTGSADATVVTITDLIPANTTFANNTYAGNTNVRVTIAGVDTFCVAEAGGTDTSLDGCVLTAGGVLTVGAPTVSSVLQGAGNAVSVRFRVTIN